MSGTSQGPAYGVDPDEAAFQRLEQGLAALRRDTSRLRQPLAGAAAAGFDPRELDASLAEVNRRIDALASRPSTPADSGPILAALTAVEAKISSLTSSLDRFVEQGALTEAMAAANARIDSLAARLDARLNQLQDKQAEPSSRPDQPTPAKPAVAPPAVATAATATPPAVAPTAAAPPVPAPATPVARPAPPVSAPTKPSVATPTPPPVTPPPRSTMFKPEPSSAFTTLTKAEPEVRRSHLPALLLLVVMVLAAAVALALIRPDLIKSDWLQKEYLIPAREKIIRVLNLSQVTTEPAPVAMSAPTAPIVQTEPQAKIAQQPVRPAVEQAPASQPPAPPEPRASAEPSPAETTPGPVAVAPMPPPEPAPSPAAPNLVSASPSIAASTDTAPADAPVNNPVNNLPDTATTVATQAAEFPNIVLGANADVWLRVRNADGQTLLERILRPGETWKAPNQRGLRFSTGNAGATSLTIDDMTWSSLGSMGGVRHDLPLDLTLLSIAGLQARKTKRQGNERPAGMDRSKPSPSVSKPASAANR